MQVIQSLEYNPISPQTNLSVARLALDGTIDTVWKVNMLGSVQGAPRNVVPKFVIVDNSLNADPVQVQMSFFIFNTPPFQREAFRIPSGVNVVDFNISGTTAINVFIAEENIADAVANQLLIQQTAAQTLVYSYVKYSASGNQQLTDGNKQILFQPVLAFINYNLLPISSTPVGNGFLTFVRNEGPFTVNIIPFGADTINGVYTAADPMILFPGDSGILSSDGTEWYYSGRLSFESGEQNGGFAAITNIDHYFNTKPDNAQIWLRCKTAEFGFSVGDELEWGLGSSVVATTPPTYVQRSVMRVTAQQFQVNIGTNYTASRFIAPFGLQILTNANWRWFIRAQHNW